MTRRVLAVASSLLPSVVPPLVPSMALAIVLSMALSSAACLARSDSPGRQWHLRGIVLAVEKDRVDIRHRSGKTVTLLLDEHTQYALGDMPAAASRLQTGRFVDVEVDGQVNAWHARYIRVARRRSDR